MDLQKGILVAIRVLLVIAGGSLAYLLFMFGHVEPEMMSHGLVLVLASSAGTCAVIAGILQWVGLPAKQSGEATKKSGKKHGAGHSK